MTTTGFVHFVLDQWRQHLIVGPVVFVLIVGFVVEEIRRAWTGK